MLYFCYSLDIENLRTKTLYSEVESRVQGFLFLLTMKHQPIEIMKDFIFIIEKMSDNDAGKLIKLILSKGKRCYEIESLVSKYHKDIYTEFEPPCPFGPPPNSGVYGVFEVTEDGNQILLYIGSSKNIRKRVSSPNHHYYKEYQKRYSVITRSIICDSYVELERKLIKKYQPLLNIIGK